MFSSLVNTKLFFKVIRNEFSLGMNDCPTSCATLLTHIKVLHIKTHKKVWLLTKAILVDVKWYFIVILICILHFLDGFLVKNPPANAGDVDSILGLGRSPEEGSGNPLQYFSPGKFHRKRCLAGYSTWGSQKVGHNWAQHTHIILYSSVSKVF